MKHSKIILIAILLAALILLVGCGKAKMTVSQVDGCTVAEIDGGVEITCNDGTVATIPDAIDGENGRDGVSSIIAVVDPCGDETTHDEVLLVFDSGSVIAWFVDAGLVELVPEQRYITTDGTRCTFEVDSFGNVTEF